MIFENTPLEEIANLIYQDNIEQVEKFITTHPNMINYQEPQNGLTLLMWSVLMEKFDSVKILLLNGADPNLTSNSNSTALFFACGHSWVENIPNKNSKYVLLLLENGANPNITYQGNPNQKYGTITGIEKGTAPLMIASNNSIDKVKELLKYGAKLNHKTVTGKTASIEALIMQEVDVAYYLIVEKKAKVDAPYYFYDVVDNSKINTDKPHLPVEILEDWLFELGTKEHKMKMNIVKEFKEQGQDYWLLEKHPKTVERIKEIYPKNWRKYLDEY